MGSVAEGMRAIDTVREELSMLDLEISTKKTTATPINNGVSFLGVEIRDRWAEEGIPETVPERKVIYAGVRPATDPVNAALSFASGLLTSEATAACAIAVLDPFAGVFYQPGKSRARDGRTWWRDRRPVNRSLRP